MHKVIVLLACDSCGRLLTRASVTNQETCIGWKAAVSFLQDELDFEFNALRIVAKRSGWHCEDPCILCFQCVRDENSFLDMLAERLQEEQTGT